MVVNNELRINKRKRKEIEEDLQRFGFDKLDNLKAKVENILMFVYAIICMYLAVAFPFVITNPLPL